MVAVERRVLDRVDRDDDAVEVRERVAAGRDPLPKSLDALGVQSDKRYARAAPELVLDLVEDVARDDGEDPRRAAAALELGQQHCDLDRLAEPDRVRHEQARLKLRHRGPERLALVGQIVGEHRVADAQARCG